MKRSVRPLFSALLFCFLAATLICRVAVRRRSFTFSSAIAELGSTSGFATAEEVAFNETLLEFAAVDPGEPKFNQEVDLISDYDNTRRSHRRYFSSMARPIDSRGRRYVPSKFPVTTPRSSLQVSRYWSEFRRNLRLWTRTKKAYEPHVILDLIRLIKNPIDSHQNGVVSEKRYSSCAVVGNSGTLLTNHHGDLIDKHEIVIRLNNAKTQRFEKKVGSKTSISFINSNILHQCANRERCHCHPYGDTVPIVMYICQPIHLLDYTVCKPSHRSPLVITDPRFDVLCARIVKYYSVKKFLEEKRDEGFGDWSKNHEGSLFHYSSGMQAVMLAVGVCERVSVFGFGKSNLTKHHYHTNQKAELKLHDYEAEYRLYHDLENSPRAVPFLPKAFKIPSVKVYH